MASLGHEVTEITKGTTSPVRGEPALVLALTALLTIVPVVSRPAAAAAGLAAVGLTIVAWQRRAPAAASLGLLFSTCLILGLAGLGPQQVVFTIAFAVYAAVVGRVRWLRAATKWLRRGRLDGGVIAAGAAIAAVSGVGLLTWYTIARPDLTDLVRTFIPDWPLWLILPGALLLSLINAAVEEAAYRGVVLEALDTSLGPGVLPVCLQSAAFGALHFSGGFPRGSMGVSLAFAYGLALGALRRQAGGLLGPWITHAVTDLVIFGIVLALARQ